MAETRYDPANVESPCVKVCALDPTRQLCVGCFRTAAEIGRWRDASDEEKRRIKAAAQARAKAAGHRTG
ncbi:MAG TPA: DUF1289 domain-containing protein [Alphaproteobacteria bacterium]|nr:DUF1289 domain-containing protein [Alphaproteobacteria bacterium]